MVCDINVASGFFLKQLNSEMQLEITFLSLCPQSGGVYRAVSSFVFSFNLFLSPGYSHRQNLYIITDKFGHALPINHKEEK
jgi:hypothetical protein